MKDTLKSIIENNDVFVAEHGPDYFKSHTNGQSPKITLVSCCDSRCQAQVVQKDPIDKVFTVETIGNQMTSAQGSVDYGILHLKTPILLIQGHTDCGAIKAFMKGYENENDDVKRELNNLKGSLKPEQELPTFEAELLSNVQKNMDYQVAVAVERYSDKVKDGSLMVVGAIYDFQNALGNDFGRMTIANINGEKDPAKIKELAGDALAGAAVGRI